MSFILDALKKSDSERQRQAGPALFEVRSAAPRSGLPTWAIVLGALLLVNIVAFGWFVTRSRAPAAAPAPAAIANAAAAPAAASAPAPVPASASAANTPPPAAPVLPPQRTAEPPLTTAEAANPADYEEALPEGSAPAPRGPVSDAGSAAAARTAIDREFVPTVDQLPASIGNQLPPLHLDLHVYATRAADRFVLVNMQRLREGDATRDGVRVEEITPTGVVLSFRGSRFQLERD